MSHTDGDAPLPGNPAVVDNRDRPRGMLPRNAHALVVMGFTGILIAVVLIAGRRPVRSALEAAPSSRPLTSENEIVRRLEAQQRLQQETLAAPDSPQSPPPARPGPEDAAWAAALGPAYGAVEPDPIETDSRLRAYRSRFASSIALSYRPQERSRPEADPLPHDPTGEGLDAQDTGPPPHLEDFLRQVASSREGQGGPGPETKETAAARSTRARPGLARSTGKQYVLFEGAVLETALLTRLAGDFAGPVICMTTTDVYSRDGHHVLVPAGTKVLGSTQKVEAFGQRRLAVAFHRLIMPDGYSVDLDQFTGLNQVGETALKDKVNNHYLQLFGASIAIGALGGLLPATASVGDARQGIVPSVAQEAMHILDRFLNVLPTITIREGHRVRVFLTQDLLLPDFALHAMPKDL